LAGGPATQPTAPTPESKAKIVQEYGNLPLSFEANRGQTDKQVKFISRGSGYSLFLTRDAAVLELNKPVDPQTLPKPSTKGTGKTDVIRMELAGSNRRTSRQVLGENQFPGRTNYFPASDPSTWHTNVPTYAKVRYSGIYPGVDLVYYGNQRQLEYDFVVAPGAGARAIRLRFAGARKLELTPEGDLEVIAANGSIAFHKPIVYQNQNGQHKPVDGSFTLAANNTVGFTLGNYNDLMPLVIDPVLAYSTYLGGTSTDQGFAIAADSTGAAYITGETTSSNFPTTAGSYQPKQNNGGYGYSSSEVFVTKLSANGASLVYSTYMGNGTNHGRGIAIDSAGDAYITGFTGGGFPSTSRSFQPSNAGAYDAFVTKLNPTGSSLIYSTFLGSSSNDYGAAIAIDANGNAFVAGTTTCQYYCNAFPVTTGAFQVSPQSGESTFVARLNSDGSKLAYSTLLGGTGSSNNNLPNGSGDGATAIALDAEDNAYVTGFAGSTNFPTTPGAFQIVNNTAKDATPGYNPFVTKINPKGTELIYSTYIGGSGTYDSAHSLSYFDYSNAIAVDAEGNATIAGTTGSANFPVTAGAYQPTNNEIASGGYNTGFVTKINPTGTALVYSTYLGGADGSENINGLALDKFANAYVTGGTYATTFPITKGAYQTQNNGSANLAQVPFLTKLNPSGTALAYSTYFGGSDGDFANAVTLDSSGNVYLTGQTQSTDFPVTSGAFQSTNNTNSPDFTAFVAKLTLPTTASVPDATTTTVTSSASPQTSGQPVTITATVTGVGTTTLPNGNVIFSIDGKAEPAAVLSAGIATYTTSSLTAGTHSITAAYGGSANFTSSKGSFSQVILGLPPAAPTITPASGSYPSAQIAAISDAARGATIYYTIDGSEPSASSPQYSAPFLVSASEVVQAIAVAPGDADSAIATANYNIVGWPTGIAVPASAVGANAATLNAIVNTLGLTGSYYFKYGTTSTALTTATGKITLSASTGPVNASAQLTTLKSSTRYYYQVVVETLAGAASGAVLSFTTE
jgi:hypothetical protein